MVEEELMSPVVVGVVLKSLVVVVEVLRKSWAEVAAASRYLEAAVAGRQFPVEGQEGP